MRIFDFLRAPTLDIPCQFDICIVGAGIVGIYIAKELSKDKTKKILIIEAGDVPILALEQNSFKFLTSNEVYEGASKGRGFGVGGTSPFWGGVLVPYSKEILLDSDPWKEVVRNCSKYSKIVLKNLGINTSLDFSNPNYISKNTIELLQHQGFSSHYSYHLPISKKNFTNLFDKKFLKDSDNLYLLKNATACNWDTQSYGDSHTIESVTAFNLKRKKITISAKKFILAAGAIENTRILLELDDASQKKIFQDVQQLGSNLSDHISVPIAELRFSGSFNSFKDFLPRLQGTSLQTLRFIHDPSKELHFLHFIFPEDENSGFAFIRDCLRLIQTRKIQRGIIKKFFQNLISILKLVYYVLLHKTLHFNRRKSFILQLDLSKSPSGDSSIKLSPTQIDLFDRKIPIITWNQTSELASIIKLQKKILESWPKKKNFPTLVKKLEININNPYDAYHPTGLTPINDTQLKVLDFDLKVNGFTNLFAISTGIFPEAGTANPTFAMLCYSHRLIESLEK